MNPLNYLYEAVGWVFTHIYDLLKPAFGPASGWTWALSIVILVVLMRLVMVPLFIKQMHTTRAMSSLQPQMAALRKKYKNDKQTLNQETMKLYQEAGVNPLMGCLPMVLQLPLFFSLFSVLRAIADWKPGTAPKYNLPLAMVQSAQHAKILGANIYDKVLFTDGLHVPLHSKLVILAAVLVSMATTYLTIRQSMKRGMMPAATPDNPMASSQKYMTYIMPLFALTGLYWPFGLVLYWVTTNVWTLGQQWILGQRYPYTPPAAADGAAVPSTAGARSLTAGGAKGSGSKGTSVKGTPVKRALPAGQAQSGGAGSSRATANGASANGKGGPGAATPGSMLKRLSNRRTEPEAEPELPDVKLVRHQTQRQSRSKRSGKR
ncbi:MAG TPA: membrane protein insertase YidC [Streptosporangiaceae bacterium]|nr:membrane protein insertase YidC [Streptosporangiaceae bacterium]